MKHLILAAILLPSVLIAQSPQRIPLPPGQAPGFSSPQGDTLPENYQVSLSIADKDGEPIEVSVVVASSRFTAAISELNLTFSGTLSIEESGAIVVAYQLGWQTPIPGANGNAPSRSSATQGSVRLKLGEEVQIIRAGSRTARLSIKKLEASKAK